MGNDERLNLALNSAIILACAISGPMLGGDVATTDIVEAFSSSLRLSFAIAGMVIFTVAISYVMAEDADSWTWFSLRRPPIVWGQPLQSFYAGALGFFGVSVGCCVYMLHDGYSNEWLFYLFLGAGMLAGTYVSALACITRK